jgi:hypothetical protein
MKTCEVVGCGGEAKRETLCVPHALCWLLSSASDKTPGREERRRAFVARASLWMQSRAGALAEGVT